jgi:hypothetical protein
MRALKKATFLAMVLFNLLVAPLFADFSEPFTDSPIGKLVTGRGWLIANSDGKSGFAVVVFTDTGHRVLQATVSTTINVQPLLGRQVTITAKIGESRKLAITDITLPVQP